MPFQVPKHPTSSVLYCFTIPFFFYTITNNTSLFCSESNWSVHSSSGLHLPNSLISLCVIVYVSLLYNAILQMYIFISHLLAIYDLFAFIRRIQHIKKPSLRSIWRWISVCHLTGVTALKIELQFKLPGFTKFSVIERLYDLCRITPTYLIN